MKTTPSPNFNDEKMAGFNLHSDLSLNLGGGGGGEGRGLIPVIFHFLLCKIVAARRSQIDTRTRGEVKVRYLFSLLFKLGLADFIWHFMFPIITVQVVGGLSIRVMRLACLWRKQKV